MKIMGFSCIFSLKPLTNQLIEGLRPALESFGHVSRPVSLVFPRLVGFIAGVPMGAAACFVLRCYAMSLPLRMPLLHTKEVRLMTRRVISCHILLCFGKGSSAMLECKQKNYTTSSRSAFGREPGFHCHPELQKGYMLQAITVALAALGYLLLMAPQFRVANR